MATMLGWWRLAAETASARNRWISSGLDQAEGHHLDRDHAVQAALPGAINHPHATAADLFQQLVVAELVGDFRLAIPDGGSVGWAGPSALRPLPFDLRLLFLRVQVQG